MKDPISKRQVPFNLSAEPPYPGHFTVVFSLAHPDLTIHLWNARCRLETAHAIADCGMFHDRVPHLTTDPAEC